MKNKNLDRFLSLSMPLIEGIDCSCKHVSFVVKKNKIISIGVNRANKTHPLARKYGARFSTIHSELDAIIRAYREKDFDRCTLVNVRLSSVSMSRNIPVTRKAKPCPSCMKLILGCENIKEVYYTTNKGWEKL
tara:strand:- start:108 stop:506 length:399 start_codon:yes stop_codon:yes gene_type:complete